MTDGLDYRQIGVVAKPHGVRGELLVAPDSDFPEWLARRTCFFVRQGAGYVPWKVVYARLHKDRLILKVDAVRSRDDAEQVRGTALFLPESEAREVLSDSDYFFNSDLVGLDVCDAEDGRCYGTVDQVLEMPADNLLQVVRAQGKPLLIPFNRAFVLDIDLEAGAMTVRLPPGLLDCYT